MWFTFLKKTVVLLFTFICISILASTLWCQEYETLMLGNERFVKEQMFQKNFGTQRTELVNGQHPYAIILTCSDSRVPPEYIFDESLGQLFVIRDAGNVASPEVIGSIEYGVEHLHSKILVVMGHEKCGAVQATYEGGKVSNNIGSILKRIKPSVDKAKKRYSDKDEALLEATKENAVAQVKAILKNSKIVTDAYKQNELKIYHALYHLSDGKVDMIEYKD